MKTLLILLISLNLYAGHYAIVSGLAWHERDTSTNGREYDVLIEGAGYQYRYKMQDIAYSGTLLAISDSNGNFMPSATLGISYNLFWDINIGADAGVSSREFMRGRKIIPVALPKVEVGFDSIIINIGYIPRIETNNIHIPQAVYVNAGISVY